MALEQARENGALVICGAVYSELLAHPGMSPALFMQFLAETGIEPEFETGRQLWQEAGVRYAKYSATRKRAKAGSVRRLLADFVIGAHALMYADRLITFDATDFRRDFPELLIAPGKLQ